MYAKHKLVFMRKNFFMLLLTIPFIFACNKDGGSTSASDPKGTVTIIIRDINHGGAAVPFGNEGYMYIAIQGGNIGFLESEHWGISIASVGSGNSLEKIDINNIPISGWSITHAAVKNQLFIVRRFDPSQDVLRFFGMRVVDSIVSTDGGILGYTVSYCPFTPEKGWNQ